VLTVRLSIAVRHNVAFRSVLLLLRGSILRKYSLEMSGKVGEFGDDWRLAALLFTLSSSFCCFYPGGHWFSCRGCGVWIMIVVVLMRSERGAQMLNSHSVTCANG